MTEATAAPPQQFSANGPASAAVGERLQSRFRERAARLARPAGALVPAQAFLEVLVFLLGEERYAIALTDVAEVTLAASVTRVPGAPPALLGVLAIRGEILPIMDLPRMIGLPARDGAARSALAGHTVVLRVPGSRLAFGADRVEGMSSIVPPSAPAGQRDRTAGHPLLTQVSNGALTFLHTQALLTVFTKEISPR